MYKIKLIKIEIFDCKDNLPAFGEKVYYFYKNENYPERKPEIFKIHRKQQPNGGWVWVMSDQRHLVSKDKIEKWFRLI